jgi:hypothetical protein
MRKWVLTTTLALLGSVWAHAQVATPASIVLENDSVRWDIGADAKTVSFVGKQAGNDYVSKESLVPVASVRKGNASINATKATYAEGHLVFEFGDAGAVAEIAVKTEKRYFVLEVLSVKGEQVQDLTFVDVAFALKGKLEEPFAGCALALNLKTNVAEIPGPSSRLRASCTARFGLEGAKAAIIACPQEQLRDVMKEVVARADELPHSNIGGPFALDADINRGSYLFDTEGISEETVDGWIDLTKKLGMTQIDFNTSFRYGDFEPRADKYPRGRASVKAVVDKLHAAGISAGLHTYAFFISKGARYVTPVPDARLGKAATFTLTKPLTAEATSIPVAESTASVSTETGFFIRNSVTVQVDNELITFSGVAKEAPYAFTGCTRGACGTKVSPHEKGAKVYQLKECFGLFTPDPDSTLLTEIAANTADTFNECGFDMIYEDALDGEDILAGGENAWHYGSKFVFEIANRLKKPALFEMSTFHHHLWCVRARMGAWDHPCRSHKRFVDLHCAANYDGRGMFLPMNLGWWAVQVWSDGSETCNEPTFKDDIEYLMCKGLGTDTGFSLMGVTPGNIGSTPAFEQLAPIFKQYEELRIAKQVPESVKSRLRKPGDEFTLEQAGGEWQFRPIQYAKHKVQGLDGWSDRWIVKNTFDPQPVRLRIEALMSAQSYDAPGSTVIEDFSKPESLADRACQDGVTASLETSTEQVKAGTASGCFSAASTRDSAAGAWARIGKIHKPPLNVAQQKGVGVWVYGDGQGELLNLQERSPAGRAVGGIGDHYVAVDFTGWRYFELVEMEGGRIADYSWPYGSDAYGVYRESVDYGQVETFALWYNNLPAGKKVTCYLSPVKALPLAKATLRNPAITVSDKTITFPVEIETGCYLEFASMGDCKLYGPKGEVIREVRPEGEAPFLNAGDNQATFACEAPSGLNPRAHVTLITQGQPFRE